MLCDHHHHLCLRVKEMHQPACIVDGTKETQHVLLLTQFCMDTIFYFPTQVLKLARSRIPAEKKKGTMSGCSCTHSSLRTFEFHIAVIVVLES